MLNRILAAAFALLAMTSLAIAQVQPGTSPLSIAKGGTGASVGRDVATIAALRALPIPPTSLTQVNVAGYYSQADGGGGAYVWNSSNVTADNGGNIIKPSSVSGAGRWVLQPSIANSYTPEQFGAFHNGGANDDGPPLRALMAFLGSTSSGGNILLACNTTYTISSLDTNAQSLLIPLSNVNIIGCGANSTIKFANAMNTSSSFFAWGIYTLGSANNVRYAHFTIDGNGANNSCSGTCYHSNAMLGIATGTNITVEDINFINNPGSNDTVFGTNVASPTVSGLTLKGNRHFNSATQINAANLDFSADFVIATSVTLSDSRYDSAGTQVSTPFELHGTNVSASNLVVRNYDTCGIISNEPTSPASPTSTVTLGNVSCNNVISGPVVFSFAGASATNYDIHDINVTFLTGNSGIGIDACSQMRAASGPNVNLSISNIVIYSDVTTNLGSDSSGVCAAYWSNVKISNVQTYNTQGPGVYIPNHVNNDIISINNNQINNPGHTSTATLQAGVVVAATGGTTSTLISVVDNYVTGTVVYGVIGAQNTGQGIVLANQASGASSGLYNWTGTGAKVYTLPGASVALAGVDIGQTFTALQQFNDNDFALKGSTSGNLVQRAPATAGSSVIRWPAGSTDFSATGGPSQFLKQASAGAPLTVVQPACADLSNATAGCSNSTAAEQARLAIGVMSATITGVNFNSANTDNAIAFTLPSGFTRILPWRVNLSHASASISTATFGMFSTTAGGGFAIQPAGTATGVSTASDATAGSANSVSTGQGASFVAASLATPNTVYFRVGTAQGSAATADVEFLFFPLP